MKYLWFALLTVPLYSPAAQIQTHVLVGEVTSVAVASCDDAYTDFDKAFEVESIDGDHVEAVALTGCRITADGIFFDYHFFLEPLTEAGIPYAEDYLARHQDKDLWGHRFHFRTARALEIEARAAYDFVSASGFTVPVYDHQASLSFPNRGALLAWAQQIGQSLQEGDLSPFLVILEAAFGSNQASHVRREVLPAAHRIRFRADWSFRLEDGARIPAFTSFTMNRDCSGFCLSPRK